MGFGECIITTDIIKSRCPVENEILYSNAIPGLISGGYRISDISYCEIKNLAINTTVYMNRITVLFMFDLVFVFEYGMDGGNECLYGIHVEKAGKSVHLEKNRFSCFFDFDPAAVCRCLIRDIRYKPDIDITMTIPAISVFCDFECFILEEGTVRVNDIRPAGPGIQENGNSSDMGVPLYFSDYLYETNEMNSRLTARVGECERQMTGLREEIIGLKRQMGIEDDNQR